MNIRYFISEVQNLKPGHYIAFDDNVLRLCRPNGLMTAILDRRTVPQIIMENVVGSAWDIVYYEDVQYRRTVFRRLKKSVADDERTYVSEDRMHYFDKMPNGIFKLKPKAHWKEKIRQIKERNNK